MHFGNRKLCRHALFAGAAAVVFSLASAVRADTLGVQVAGALGSHSTNKVDVVLAWDPGIDWWHVGGWHFALIGEANVAYWHTTEGASRNDVYELGVTPFVRFIKDTGSVRPYIEAGAGLRGLTHPTVSDRFTVSTAFQFTEVIGVGAQFGGHQQYEAGLRFQHISNGGIKEPNPGINFSQLYVRCNF
jgi:lipid A 3-O-deacylase